VVVRKFVLESAAEVRGEQCHRSESVIVWLSFSQLHQTRRSSTIIPGTLLVCQDWVYAVEPKRNSPL
jgi:hypothetical protein